MEKSVRVSFVPAVLVLFALSCAGTTSAPGGAEGGAAGEEASAGSGGRESSGGRGGAGGSGPGDAGMKAGTGGGTDAAGGAEEPDAGGSGGSGGSDEPDAAGTGGSQEPDAGGGVGGGAGGGAGGSSDCPVPPVIYTPPPASGWITAPGEQRMTLTLSSGDLAGAQAEIDKARAANANTVLDIRMSGTFMVTASPLKLPSLSSLVLTGTLRAAPGATAGALVSIDGASKVAVAGGTLDGGGAALAGISVTRSSKVNIDKVTIAAVGGDGIVVDGTGNATPEVRVAIVRCSVSGAGKSGIAVKNAAQVVVVNNVVAGSGAAGITVGGTHAVVANNTVQAGATGIQVAGDDNAISKNSLCGNATGLALTPESNANSLFQNTLTGALALGGMGNLVFDNTTASVKNGGSGNYVLSTGAAVTVAGNNYFRPPTLKNRHQDATIVNGRGRQDVAVMGTTLDQVQVRYDAARAAHPNDFIVLTLTGTFHQSGAGVELQSYTAVVLDGTITVDPGTTGGAFQAAAGTSFISISGGTIEGNGRNNPAIEMSTSMVYLDGVTAQHFGVGTTRTGKGAVHLSGNGAFGVVRGCRVDGTGGRAIWTQNAGRRYLMLNNHVSNANMDGIDFDSHTSNSIATGNRSESNTRYGVFRKREPSRTRSGTTTWSRTPSP